MSIRSTLIVVVAVSTLSCAKTPIPEYPMGEGRAADAPLDASKWQVLQGDFQVLDNTLEATGGAIIYKEQFEGVRFSATVERLAGDPSPYISFGWYSNLFYGGQKRYLDGTADWENYSFEFSFAGEATLFRGRQGKWASLHWKGYEKLPALRPDKNHIQIESKDGTHKITVNGQLVHVEQNSFHKRGAVSFWVADKGSVFRFSNISIEAI